MDIETFHWHFDSFALTMSKIWYNPDKILRPCLAAEKHPGLSLMKYITIESIEEEEPRHLR